MRIWKTLSIISIQNVLIKMDHLKEYVKEWMAFYESEGAFEDKSKSGIEWDEESKFEMVMEDVCSIVNEYRFSDYKKDEK